MRCFFICAALILIAFSGTTMQSASPIYVNPLPTPPSVENAPRTNSVVRNGSLLIKPDGWQMPDVSKLNITFARQKFKCREFKENRFIKCSYPAKVYRTNYDPAGLELPKMNYDGTPDGLRKIMLQSDIDAYDINKRVFCYRTLAWNVPLEGEAGVSVVIYHTYYDLDGDGIFESWDVEDLLQKPLKMPQWIKP